MKFINILICNYLRQFLSDISENDHCKWENISCQSIEAENVAVESFVEGRRLPNHERTHPIVLAVPARRSEHVSAVNCVALVGFYCVSNLFKAQVNELNVYIVYNVISYRYTSQIMWLM